MTQTSRSLRARGSRLHPERMVPSGSHAAQLPRDPEALQPLLHLLVWVAEMQLEVLGVLEVLEVLDLLQMLEVLEVLGVLEVLEVVEVEVVEDGQLRQQGRVISTHGVGFASTISATADWAHTTE